MMISFLINTKCKFLKKIFVPKTACKPFFFSCWLNLDAPEAAAIIAPNTILILLTFLILIVTIFGSSSNDELQQTDHYTNRTRYIKNFRNSKGKQNYYKFFHHFRTLQKNRYVLLAITSLMSLGWTFGITSAHFQESGLIITFLLVHFILAVVILALRAIWDDQVSFAHE